ncbi:UDP-N-acetylmuramoyl-L-alanine--D-glutamate ligase [Pseudoalteromonas sp. G4]|uniref:UDP-N-acetylmuramoyl-L-alanine--D-glutamate ligase n=1 Tax=Pseudoalteromonas sp. G4 TaxID=2992761 RepID=UPI00237ED27B|nr:UDP-N-acetylmuramoyl-L-alanine--D-glutamate ligase [Pseudoalteromonas sp. G4]MDE3271214.1 UDP-N-acetylmuramoyl-L-alanine--D-glutamate ligase [Pseudoalteromonas sp. G4]
MNYLDELKNKKIIVLGLGVSGLSTMRFFARKNIDFSVVDSREVPPNEDVAKQLANSFHFGKLTNSVFEDAELIVISPGIALSNMYIQDAISRGVEVIGDVELFARLNTKPVYAVTGSNGKSSVVTLTRDVLKQAGFNVALAGNIGTPVLDVVDEDFDCYVLELSSFQLETTYSLVCEASCVLNISEDHMDRYDSLVDYANAKQRIHLNSKLAVVNCDDALTHTSHQPQVSFSAQQGDYQLTNQYFSAFGESLLTTAELSVIGLHNQLNALAVMALLKNLDLSVDVFKAAFNQFSGLAHRCQLIAEHNNVLYVNDSKATNVGATQAALMSLANSKNIILLAGGVGKGADFSPLKSEIETYVKQLITFGEDRAKIAALSDNTKQVESLELAVQLANECAVSGDIVLLAPACSSFDMFKSFEHRGEVFSELVHKVVNA